MLRASSDDELMELIKAGKPQAFETLFDRHSSAVYGYCLRTLGGNRAMADDILQEVWFKVARQAQRYEARGQFKAWLMTIARHELISQVRKQVPLHDDPGEDQAEASEDPGSEAKMLLQTDARKAHNAIQSLPESQRVVLMLSIVDELPHEEIGKSLGISVAAVRSLLFRARTELRAKLRKA